MNADEYIIDELSNDTIKVYYPTCLPFRTTMVMKSSYGKRVITKEVLNVISDTPSGYVVHKDGATGIADMRVVISVSGKPRVATIGARRHYLTGENGLTCWFGDNSYDILSIDGQDAMVFAPHIKHIV